MQARIQKWGNSLAIRIPKAFADEVGIEADAPIEISLVNGQIVIVPKPELTLEDLLAGVTDENRHGEIDFGPPMGKEIW